MSDYVTVIDRYEKTLTGIKWSRKIGNGDWEYVSGNAPVLIFNPEVQWVEQKSLHDPAEFDQ